MATFKDKIGTVAEECTSLNDTFQKKLKEDAGQTFSRCAAPLTKFAVDKSIPPLKLDFMDGKKMPPPRHYRVPQHLLPELRKFVQEMVEKGWISKSRSPFSSPVLVIRKPGNRGYRFVVDFSGTVNPITKTLNHHIPDVNEMWDKLREAKYKSCLDLKHGFWLAALDEE